jgi:hypothetical protein
MDQLVARCVKFFKDSDGRIVIWQQPNIPLIGWLLFAIASFFIKTSPWQNFLAYVSFGFLFTWAWLETTQGKSYFRRTLGVVVLLLAIYPHFK